MCVYIYTHYITHSHTPHTLTDTIPHMHSSTHRTQAHTTHTCTHTGVHTHTLPHAQAHTTLYPPTHTNQTSWGEEGGQQGWKEGECGHHHPLSNVCEMDRTYFKNIENINANWVLS